MWLCKIMRNKIILLKLHSLIETNIKFEQEKS